MKAKTITGVLASAKGLAAALALFGITSAASADIVYVTYSGTVLSGYDQIGIFGAPGSSLAGDAYTTFYIFNTSVGEIHSDPFFNSDLGGVVGIYAQPSPSLGAVLTINGISMGIGGGSVGYLYGIDYGDFSRSYDLAGDPSRSVYNQMSDPTRSIPVSINMPFSYTVTPANGGYGQGQAMLGIDPVSGAAYLIDLVPTTVSVSVPGAVPEPSTWAMMLIGLAGLGFVACHRQKRALSSRRL
jgi:PEP-CTERM motif